jgi:two-component system cell cycle sensor histidine kinase/response regulator CckA
LRGGRVEVESEPGQGATFRRSERPPDLLLTDTMMPETSGPALAEELREGYPALRVLYMSGYADLAVTGNGDLRSGYLSRPLTVETLGRRVRQVLEMG